MIRMPRLAPMSRTDAINAATLPCLDLVFSPAHPSHAHTRSRNTTHTRTDTHLRAMPAMDLDLVH